MTPPDRSPPDSSHSEEAKSPAGHEEPAPAPAAYEPGELFVVGVGASAGGLEAITELLRPIPRDAGLTVLVVQHLDPQHQSLLVELLGRASAMPVSWAQHGQSMEGGQVYVAPAKFTLGVHQGVMLVEEDGRRFPGGINHLFASLAAEFNDRAIGVILSGTGTDGTTGAKAIKTAGGIIFAQNEESAAFPDMPRAAIDAGCADRVLSPAGIAEELVRLSHTARVVWEQVDAPDDDKPAAEESEQLRALFGLLLQRTGVDFAEYKPSTIWRRIIRRMLLARTRELGDYIKLLQKNREELGLLFESLLINVTDFFRDRDYFEYLEQNLIPEILRQHADGTPIRVWVPGCSSGEEVYSIAILFREKMELTGTIIPVNIFGTDLSEAAVAAARAGRYSRGDVSGVDSRRLQRFFSETDRGFVIQKYIRDMCIFARQNVVRDSPFSRLDLVSCRNLMIYLGQKLQRKLMPIFHYALTPGGFLMLGSSESVGSYAEMFRLVDRRYRIYARKAGKRRTDFDFNLEPSLSRAPAEPKTTPVMRDAPKDPFDIIREADRIVLGRHGPTGVLVTEDLEILQFRGDVSPFLAPVDGRASLNLIKMAREGLATELQSSIEEARQKQVRIQRTGVTVRVGKDMLPIEIDVTPIDSVQSKEKFYLVLFSPAATAPTGRPAAKKSVAGTAAKKSAGEALLDQLRQDLNATRNYLQSTIERHEFTNQELRAANEEIQSSNEELQSTNEELETAKEELQSTNEELTTVNEELHSRQIELLQLNNDLNNLINSVHLPIVILAQDMRIRRFTPMAEKVLNLIPTDVGRPLMDLNINLRIDNLPGLLVEVMESLTTREVEVQDNSDRWYSMRLRPYRTVENKIDGVVIVLIDIDQIKRINAELVETRDLAEATLETIADPTVALDANLRIKKANRAFYRVFQTSAERAEGFSFFDAVNETEKLKALRRTLEGILPTHSSLTNHEVRLDLPGTGPTQLVINVHQIASVSRKYQLILLSLRPI